MKSRQIPYKDIIRLRKNQEMPNIYDVELEHIQKLKEYNSLECHIVVYPYSRKLCSDNIEFHPFEEYVKDILTDQKSAYIKISSQFDKTFGLLLGLITILFLIRFNPRGLFSVESIVSVFGVYFIGKELWDDIENLLINISRKWKIRYYGKRYLYRLEKHTTLTYYSYLAKKERYGKTTLLPEKIDFIQQSNSQTLRMYFNIKDLQSVKEPSAHILSVNIEPELLEEFEKEGYMFGVKLSFNKSYFGPVRCFELFQSFSKGSKGCLNEKGDWIDNAIFYRNTLRLGRLKYYMSKGFAHEKSIIGA